MTKSARTWFVAAALAWYGGWLSTACAADDAHMAFQQLILREDEPVVCNHDPPELPLDTSEVSVRTDRVSIEYRRWLRELALAAAAPDPARAIGEALANDEEQVGVSS